MDAPAADTSAALAMLVRAARPVTRASNATHVLDVCACVKVQEEVKREGERERQREGESEFAMASSAQVSPSQH